MSGGVKAYMRLVRASDGRPLTTWGTARLDWQVERLGLGVWEPVTVRRLWREEYHHWSAPAKVLCRMELRDGLRRLVGLGEPFMVDNLGEGDLQLVFGPTPVLEITVGGPWPWTTRQVADDVESEGDR